MALSSPSAGGVALTGFRPTTEQQRIQDSFVAGNDLVVEALAGTGKTTTLKALAAQQPRRPGLYLAFNKSIVLEARGKFPDAVTVTTAHALAYKAVGHNYGHRLPGNGSPRVGAQRMANLLKVKATDVGGGMLNPVLLTRLAQATVMTFTKSDSKLIGLEHLPARASHLGVPMNDLAAVVVPIARRIWEDLSSTNGQFYFAHDHYLKLWQLREPRLNTEYIMFDEAQDADPVIASIVGRQHHTQRIYVGDQNQAIYGWRGAVNAMGQVQNATRLPLTRSFRFGPAIAEQANRWLIVLGSPLRVTGHDPIQSSVSELYNPRAILCRTNGTALGWVIAFQEGGVKVALAPGDRTAGKDIEQFAWAARDLMSGNGTDHPDLSSFTTWNEVCDYAEEEEDGADLKRLVGIINRIGVNGVINAIRGLTPERDALVTVSTAHKAKGLEWDSVKVADDFTPPEDDEETDPADLMLAYVTVTRAKLQLDPGSLTDPLAWLR